LHVSYNSVPDTTLGITDDKLKEYYNKNKSKYKVTANREIKYFSLPIQPTPEDAQLIFKETQDLVNTFAETQDDSAFVDANSDAKENFALLNVGNLPEQITMNGSLPEVGKVYGPFAEREAYKLFKVIGIKDDSLFSVRASHILIKPETEDAAGKAEAKKKATDILNKIKNGADFAQLASEFGTDGTASRGGDLGWFTEGTMVTPFNDAVFSAKLGLIPRIVETNFGFHVVKVTAEKTKKKYIVATITKDITPSDETRDIIYKRAAKYAAIKKQEDFLAALKADSTIRVDEDLNVDKKDRNLNTIYTPSVREIIRWTYSDDTEVGDVSDVFDLNDQFVVATLLKANEDDELDFELVKTQVRTDLVIELQKQEILAKLTPLKGSLDDIAKAYGANAYVYSAPNVTMSAGSLIGVGAAVESIGAIFGLKEGATSKPIADKYGVVMVSLNKINKVAEIADYSTQKNQIKTSATQSIITSAAKAIEKFYDIKDFTYKFF
jgi:peptidyl-prolyl cis-trans isomerase D